MTASTFWIYLLEIIGINIILSGDNAVVIALAARSLPERYRRAAILFGSAGAILMRIALTIAAAELLTLPWLRLIGGILLLWIGVQLLVPDDDDGGEEDGAKGVWQAVRTILLADLIMSLDNVLGVAAASHGSILLLIIGLAISIPLIVFGSALILKVMDRYPVVITMGAALIGYVAGEMLVADAVVAERIPEAMRDTVTHAAAIAGAGLVVGVGLLLGRRRKAPEQVIDLDGEPGER
jgi:YjbE family integral membrane protein